jgi:hypothetical protein
VLLDKPVNIPRLNRPHNLLTKQNEKRKMFQANGLRSDFRAARKTCRPPSAAAPIATPVERDDRLKTVQSLTKMTA